ncbi:MAG TPA: alpha/beta hydrolase [Candidatus Cybelea sp.]|nr:alpha/beta hydrolase [Candidatus Cybelea sp.]
MRRAMREVAMQMVNNEPRIGSFQGCSPTGFHEVFYAEWGDPAAARVIVCCHGLTRNGRDFDFLARRLADGIDFALAERQREQVRDHIHETAPRGGIAGWIGARLERWLAPAPEPAESVDANLVHPALQPLPVRVICPDVTGRGRSEWLKDPANYGYPQYMSDMTALIARLGVPQVDWIGTSMGGLIGMFLAASPNSPIRSLVINDVGPVVPRAAMQRIADYVGLDPRFDSLDALEAYLRKVHAPFGPLTDAQWAHLARHSHRFLADGSYGLAYDPGIAINARLGVRDWDFWASWDRVTCPALIVRGQESDLLEPEVAEAMTVRGPKAELIEFPGVGHAPSLMADDQIERVSQWLARQG